MTVAMDVLGAGCAHTWKTNPCHKKGEELPQNIWRHHVQGQVAVGGYLGVTTGRPYITLISRTSLYKMLLLFLTLLIEIIRV